MAAEERPVSGRINLAEPGERPPPPRSHRWWKLSVIALVVAGLGTGAFLVRGPIARGTSTAADAVWDAWGGWSSALRDRAAEIPDPVPTTTLPPPEPVASRAMLIVVGTGAGDSGFALLVRPPVGASELVLIPQTLLVQVPGFGEFSMAEALAFGGPALARLALANEMGLRIDDLIPLGADGLDALGADLVVDVPVELYVENEDGSRRLIAPGPQRLSIDLVELVLAEQGTGNQFDWLRRQEAVWEGLLEAVATSPDIATRISVSAADPIEAAEFLVSLASAPSIGAPPLDRVAVGASRNAMVLATDRIEAYLAEDLGHLALSETRRPRVEILNGNGVAGSGVPIAAALVAEGFYIFRSGNADRFDHATSQVIAQGEDAAADAREAAAVLGIPDVLLQARAPSGVVDVSIIVGTDLAPREG